MSGLINRLHTSMAALGDEAEPATASPTEQAAWGLGHREERGQPTEGASAWSSCHSRNQTQKSTAAPFRGILLCSPVRGDCKTASKASGILRSSPRGTSPHLHILQAAHLGWGGLQGRCGHHCQPVIAELTVAGVFLDLRSCSSTDNPPEIFRAHRVEGVMSKWPHYSKQCTDSMQFLSTFEWQVFHSNRTNLPKLCMEPQEPWTAKIILRKRTKLEVTCFLISFF